MLSRLLVLCIILLAFGAGFFKALDRRQPAPFEAPPIATPSGEEPRFRAHFASARLHTNSHAASLIELHDGRVRAFWFAGSLEGALDVEIRSSVFDPRLETWGPERTVASRQSTQRSLLRYIKRIGNPVPGQAGDGTLQLFYVTVSAGGWSGSSITAMTSSDDGDTWGPARRLVSSPFLNISTLAKGAPFLYADGTMGLPVYHELVGHFSELMRLGPDGAVLDKQRLSAGTDGVQPVVLIKNEREALALMRYSGRARPKRALAAVTRDAGLSWTSPVKSRLANPNSALSGVVLPDGRILVALNESEEDRDVLSLVMSGDGGATWRTVCVLEDQSALRSPRPDRAQFLKITEGLAAASGLTATDARTHAESAERQLCEERCRFEFSYPYLIRTRNGDFHLVYTWNRSFIKHIWFDQAWLDSRVEQSTDG